MYTNKWGTATSTGILRNMHRAPTGAHRCGAGAHRCGAGAVQVQVQVRCRCGACAVQVRCMCGAGAVHVRCRCGANRNTAPQRNAMLLLCLRNFLITLQNIF